ncbi:hypothetical protein GGI03_001320 [Coemansia sp. RSA 2337]|nr:hypothetical protein H4S03_004578 [Coemansia sp. S3946]KAJ2335619.1 hypothetical protein GGH92_007977 [Coemansia sp. RSA 2673]KAJ2467887.1 hypothetical protein GGI03_001320 [Coemansia sp. RSA 2337]
MEDIRSSNNAISASGNMQASVSRSAVSPARGPNKQLTPLDTSVAKAHGLQIQLPTPEEAPLLSWCATSPVELGANGLLSPKFPTPAEANESDPNAFMPYFMQTAEPRAPELQRQPSTRIAPPRRESKLGWPGSTRRSSESASATTSASASPALLPTTTGLLTPNIAADSLGEDGGSSVTMLKRSLSTLLRRSTSIVRRTDSNSRRRVDGGSGNVSTRSNLSEDRSRSQAGSSVASTRSSPQTPADTPSSSQATSPQLTATSLPPVSDFGEALSASTFSVGMANATISPLIGNSMVHVKVIMDAANIAIVPMVRSVVFARARERILTKLFQGGVPFVHSKRRKLAVRKPDDSMVVVADNQTWRCVMDAASAARANQPGVAADATAAGYKTVVKLTLHLIDPVEITDRLAVTGCRPVDPTPLQPAISGRACST